MIPGAGIFRTELPIGFSAGGINCGVRRYRPDLGVIMSETPCVANAVYTQNVCVGAPITYCRQLLPADNIKAIITNSGQANAATGALGNKNNQLMANTLANILNCQPQQVLTASTGVIGEQLELDKILPAIPSLVASVSNIAEKFALSIMTTDLVPKTAFKKIVLSQGTVHLTGISKGSGMIHPNMATMLGYLLTDATLSQAQSQKLLKTACDNSFNQISVDGDTSSNDCVFMMSNGMSNISLKTAEDYDLFYSAVEEIAITLAKAIARDGEGASKLIDVTVSGLPSQSLARQVARSIITSPLVKTAAYGESANWGRILAKLGNTGITAEQLEQCVISIQNTIIYPEAHIDRETLSQKMQEDTLYIAIQFNRGIHQASAWGCDLTEKYITINAEYLT